MATITLDTYQFVEELTDAGISEEHAKAIARAFKKTDMQHVATKEDLANLRADIFKWAVPILVAQAGLIVALIKFL